MAPRHEDETDQKKRLIGRRTLLKLTGAAAVGTGLSATFGNAYAQTIDLGAKGLSPGDDLSPYLDTHWRSGNEVHIPGGTYKLSNPASLAITADQDSKLVGDGQVIADHGRTSNNWNVVAKGSAHVRIENITLKGKDTGGNSKIRPFATSKGGLVELVNFNRPDGTLDGRDADGCFVPKAHTGTTRLINCHIEGFSNNGLYASSAAKGGNGPVEVYGGLFKNNDVAGVRLGSSGSKAYHVTVVNDATAPGISGGNNQRGIRVREPGPVEIHDCDITQKNVSGATAPIDVEDMSWQTNLDGYTHIKNVRIRNDTGRPCIDTEGSSSYETSGDGIHLWGSGNMTLEGSGPYTNVTHGTGSPTPRTTKRIVDPNTLQPVDGGTSSGGSTTTSSGSSDPVFEVIAASGGPLFSYSFTASGAVTKMTNVGDMSAESNDTVVQNADGSSTVNGQVGNGFGDSFQVAGDLTSFSADTDPSNYSLKLDGTEISPGDIGGGSGATTHQVQVVAGSNQSLFSYSFDATGVITKVTDAGKNSAESNDEVVQNSDGTYTLTGQVANGYGDSFDVAGDLTSFTADSGANFTLYVDGKAVDPSTVGGQTPLPNSIVFDASGGEQGTYSFSVSDSVESDPDKGTFDTSDSIDGQTVSGDVSGGVDAYRFSGDIVKFEMRGSATVTIDDGN